MKISCHVMLALLLVFTTILFVGCGGGQKTGPVEKVTLRSETAELSKDEIMQMVNEKGFHCPGEYVKGTFKHSYEQAELRGVKIINDHATGLMWQQAENTERMGWKEAEVYVASMNQEGLAGFSDWRIPTAEELLSLMETKKQNDYFIAPVFHEELLSTWSIDVVKGGFAGAWFVDFGEGGAGEGNRAAGLGHVRLVRMMEPME